MLEEEARELFEWIEREVVERGGGSKQGVISRQELEEAGEIRVSIRPPRFLGSTEIFTLRDLEPGDYHLMLIAVPRKMDGAP